MRRSSASRDVGRSDTVTVRVKAGHCAKFHVGKCPKILQFLQLPAPSARAILHPAWAAAPDRRWRALEGRCQTSSGELETKSFGRPIRSFVASQFVECRPWGHASLLTKPGCAGGSWRMPGHWSNSTPGDEVVQIGRLTRRVSQCS